MYQNSAAARVASVSIAARNAVTPPSRAAVSIRQMSTPRQRPVQSTSVVSSSRGRMRCGGSMLRRLPKQVFPEEEGRERPMPYPSQVGRL